MEYLGQNERGDRRQGWDAGEDTILLTYIEGDGVGALVHVAQGGLYGAVAGKPWQARQHRCADADGKVAFPAAIVARMARMAVAFIDHRQLGWAKGACQAILYVILDVHFSAHPFYRLQIGLNF